MALTRPTHSMDELEWLQFQRQQTAKQLRESRQRMQGSLRSLTQSSPMPNSGMERIMFFAKQGQNIYQGVKLGYKVMSILTLVLGLRRMFKRK